MYCTKSKKSIKAMRRIVRSDGQVCRSVLVENRSWIVVLYAVMRRVDKYVQLAMTVGAGLVATPVASISLHDAFNSQQAYAYTSEIAGLGERWPGSRGHEMTENLIHQVLQKDGAQSEADNFIATTPRGPVTVHNIIGKFNVSPDSKQDI